MASTTNQSVKKAKERVMVTNTTQTVVNENTEETVTTVGLNTHPGDALPMARNAITAKKGTFLQMLPYKNSFTVFTA